MAISRSQCCDTLKQELASLDTLMLGKPAWMTLPDYLSKLAAVELIGEREAHHLLATYEKARFGAAAVSEEDWQQALQPLQTAQEKAAALSIEQREAVALGWEPLVPSASETDQAPADTEGTSEGQDTQEGEDAFVDALSESTESPPQEPTEATSEAPVAPIASSGVYLPPGRILMYGSMGFLFWGLTVLLGVWLGAKNYEPVVRARYAVSNRIARWLEFAEAGIPSRYKYREVARMRGELNRWREWWQEQRELYKLRWRYRRSAFHRWKLKLAPKQSKKMWKALGSKHFAKKQYAYAIVFFERALQLTPHDPELLNDLAWLLCTSEDPLFRDPTRALQLAREAYHRKRRSYIADTLAEAYAQNNMLVQAIDMEKWAYENAPQEDREDYRQELERYRRMAKALARKETPQTRKATAPSQPTPSHKAPTSKPTSRPTH